MVSYEQGIEKATEAMFERLGKSTSEDVYPDATEAAVEAFLSAQPTERDNDEPQMRVVYLGPWTPLPDDVPKCSHGFDQPHIMGGKTGFHYDHPWHCSEWESKGGLFVQPYRIVGRETP